MFRLSVVPRTIRTILHLTVAGLALAVGLTLLSFTVGAAPALASTCKNIYTTPDGGNGDMPLDPGMVAMPPKGCTDAPTQPPAVKAPDPVVRPNPVVPVKPADKPKTSTPPKASKPKTSKPAKKAKAAPKVTAQPQRSVRPATPVRPTPPVVKQATKKATPVVEKKVKKAAPKKAKPEVKTATVNACAGAMVPVVTTDFHFPWLLATGAMLMALLAGGVAFTRTFIATGHKWPAKVRRVIAGPDHRRIDS